MSELDKFVLKYEVESKDATKRLEQLNEQVGKVNTGFKGAADNAKKFASGAAEELGKVVPGLNAITAAVREMAAGFGAAGVAVAGLAAGVRALNYAREQSNIRRLAAQTYGIGPTSQEDIVQKLTGANVPRDTAQGILGKTAALLSGARRDISGTAKESLVLRQLNLGRNATPQDVLSAFAAQSADAGAAIANNAGFTGDEFAAMRKVGPEGFRHIGLSSDTIKNMHEGDAAAQELNKDLAELNNGQRQSCWPV